MLPVRDDPAHAPAAARDAADEDAAELARLQGGRAAGLFSLPAGLTVTGEIAAAEHVRIDGRFDGEIVIGDHDLVIGRRAQVKGSVFARSVIIHGAFTGNVTAGDVVDVRETASVEARVLAPAFALEAGGRFNGSVNTKRADAAVRVARYRMERRA